MTLQGHTDMAMHAEFSFDGTLLLTAAQDNKARVWDMQTGSFWLTAWSVSSSSNPYPI